MLASLFLLSAEIAYANVPIGAAAFLAYPTVSYLTSSAIALVIAVVIESLVFWSMTKFEPTRVLLNVVKANVISSLYGVVVFLSFSSSFMFFIMVFPLSYALGKNLKYLCEETQCFNKTRRFSIIIAFIFLILCSVFGSLLLPATDAYMHKRMGALSFNMIAAYSGVMILLGFIMTNLIEASVIIKTVTVEREGVGRLVVRAVLAMNLCSYIVLSALYGKSIFGFVLKAA